jgi:trimethylamine:corrinoid methyltransferase-like protein
MLDELIFERLVPDITIHGKLIDEYLTDQRSEYHITARNEKDQVSLSGSK